MTTEAKKVSGSTRTNIVVQVQGQDHITEPNKIDNTNTNKIHWEGNIVPAFSSKLIT